MTPPSGGARKAGERGGVAVKPSPRGVTGGDEKRLTGFSLYFAAFVV